MARKQPYAINYDQAAKEHLRAVEPKYHSRIRAAIEERLQFEPAKEIRNRKPLRQPAPFEATWEIRFGPGNCFRVLHGIDEKHREVQIQAIGVNKGNRLWVGGEEVAADFVAYVKATKSGPVIVTSNGKPVAVLLRFESIDELERLLMGHSPKLQSILEAAPKRFREGHGIPHETFWKEIEAENAGKSRRRGRTAKNGRTRR